MDFNSHMRNTAFLDKSADVRMMFFAEHGFPMGEFVRQQIGPVIRKDEIEYFREIRLLEDFRVTLALAGLSDDGSRFVLRNEFSRVGEQLAARVTSAGGWLDLSPQAGNTSSGPVDCFTLAARDRRFPSTAFQRQARWRLTIHSSRARFAGRLNSGVKHKE